MYRSASQLQRRRDQHQLDSDDVAATARSLAPGRHFADHSSSETTGSLDFVRPGKQQHDGLRQACPGPMTDCVVSQALERISGGVSMYELANLTRLAVLPQDAASPVIQSSVVTPPSDERAAPSSTAVQVTAPSTVPRLGCEVLHFADQKNEATRIPSDRGPLHNALQAQCVRLLDRDCTYSTIENQLLPQGMCTTHDADDDDDDDDMA